MPPTVAYFWIVDVETYEKVAVAVHEPVIVDVDVEALLGVEFTRAQEARHERRIGSNKTCVSHTNGKIRNKTTRRQTIEKRKEKKKKEAIVDQYLALPPGVVQHK